MFVSRSETVAPNTTAGADSLGLLELVRLSKVPAAVAAMAWNVSRGFLKPPPLVVVVRGEDDDVAFRPRAEFRANADNPLAF